MPGCTTCRGRACQSLVGSLQAGEARGQTAESTAAVQWESKCPPACSSAVFVCLRQGESLLGAALFGRPYLMLLAKAWAW